MFDYVNFECICPVCHSKVTGFQTKDTACNLDTVSPVEADRFYTNCGKCGCWIEFNAVKEPPPAERTYIRTVEGKFDPSSKERPLIEEHTKTMRIKA